MMLGGVEVPEQSIERAFSFGEKLLVWLENPDHWVPAGFIILGIAVWKGHPIVVRRKNGR